MNVPHHFPPDFLELLVNTIPRLVRSKDAVLDFFKNTGVHATLLQPHREQVRRDRNSISKFTIVRSVLVALNDKGDAALGVRRELVRRIVQWDDFSTAYDNDRLQAQGLVAQIRQLVGVKDAFTRMQNERDREAEQRKREYDQKAIEKLERTKARSAIRDRLAALYAGGINGRGKLLEGVLNDLFKLEGIAARDAFHVVGSGGEGIIEQIDGAVLLSGKLYLVEMKWWSKPLGVEQTGAFLPKVFSRPDCGGIFIAEPRVTEPALPQFRDAIVLGRTVIICELQEIYRLLEKDDGNLDAVLNAKIERAILDKNPFVKIATV